jgi:hypothetical protein
MSVVIAVRSRSFCHKAPLNHSKRLTMTHMDLYLFTQPSLVGHLSDFAWEMICNSFMAM